MSKDSGKISPKELNKQDKKSSKEDIISASNATLIGYSNN
jgi:hypothetical protein